MDVIASIPDLRRNLAGHRAAGRSIGLVPTMGALHEGHLSLIREARRRADVVVVSIYVNPTQFVAGEDLKAYPQRLETDGEACRAEGVDVVFAPDDAAMYGDDSCTRVAVSGITEVLCGPCRPGHFDGVTTVVAKLFNIVQPDVAVFGQKDAQQAIVIRKMAEDLRFPVEIVVGPTVREPDGLALSSRNAYLTPEQRARATALSGALQVGRHIIEEGEIRPGVVREAMGAHLRSAGVDSVDYVEIRDAASLGDVTTLAGRLLLAVAAQVGRARLIDNVEVEVPSRHG